MVKEDIETVIDRLLEFVKTRGEVSLNDAAAAMARTPSQIERLALLLEESGFIEVRYTLTGVKLAVHREEEQPNEEKLARKQAAEKADQIIAESDRLEQEVMQSENLLKFFETDIERRVKVAEALLSDLEARKEFTKKELEYLRKEVDLALKQLQSFGEEIKKLGAREGEFQSKLARFGEKLKGMEVKTPAAVKKAAVQAPAAAPVAIDARERVMRFVQEILQVLKVISEEVQSNFLKPVLKPNQPIAVVAKARKPEKEVEEKKLLPPIAQVVPKKARGLGGQKPYSKEWAQELERIQAQRQAAPRSSLEKPFDKQLVSVLEQMEKRLLLLPAQAASVEQPAEKETPPLAAAKAISFKKRARKQKTLAQPEAAPRKPITQQPTRAPAKKPTIAHEQKPPTVTAETKKISGTKQKLASEQKPKAAAAVEMTHKLTTQSLSELKKLVKKIKPAARRKLIEKLKAMAAPVQSEQTQRMQRKRVLRMRKDSVKEHYWVKKW